MIRFVIILCALALGMVGGVAAAHAAGAPGMLSGFVGLIFGMAALVLMAALVGGPRE